MSGFDCLGADSIGDMDYGMLFQVAGGLIQGGVSMAEQSKAEKKSAGEEQSKLDAAIAADLTATSAAVKADLSAAAKSKSAKADLAAAERAVARQNSVGADLSPESAQKRVDAAEAQLGRTKKVAAAKKNDDYQNALVKAWTATVAKLKNPGGVSEGGKGKERDAEQESFWSRPLLGHLSGGVVVGGGVALVAVVGLVIKKMVSH